MLLAAIRTDIPLASGFEVLVLGAGPWSIALGIAGRVAQMTIVEPDPILARLARESAAQQGLTNVTVIEPPDGAYFGPEVITRRYDRIIALPPIIPCTDAMKQALRREFMRAQHGYIDTFFRLNDGGPTGRAVYDQVLEWAPVLLRPEGALLTYHAQWLSWKKTQAKLQGLQLASAIVQQRTVRSEEHT